MPALTRHANCACCGDPMEPGEQFRWVDKQVAAGSKVSSNRTVYRPAHIYSYCGARKFAREQLSREIADAERTIAIISAMTGCEHAVVVLRDQIDAARSKLDAVASW